MTKDTDGGHRRRVVEVRHTTVKQVDGSIRKPSVPFETLESILPKRIDGRAGEGTTSELLEDVPVKLVHNIKEEQGPNYYDYSYDPLVGGCAVFAFNKWVGTIGSPAWDDGRGQYIVTGAAHSFDSTSDVYVYQNADRLIGWSDRIIKDGPKPADVASIQPDYICDYSSCINGVDYDIADDTGGSRNTPIYGMVAKDEIKDNVDNGSYQLHLQGAREGNHAGMLLDYSDSTIDIGVETNPGDSGGIYYKLENGKAYTAGIHDWAVDDDGDGVFDDSGGTAWYYIEDQWPVWV